MKGRHGVPYEGGLKRPGGPQPPGGPRIAGASMEFWLLRARALGAATTQETGWCRVFMGGFQWGAPA